MPIGFNAARNAQSYNTIKRSGSRQRIDNQINLAATIRSVKNQNHCFVFSAKNGKATCGLKLNINKPYGYLAAALVISHLSIVASGQVIAGTNLARQQNSPDISGAHHGFVASVNSENLPVFSDAAHDRNYSILKYETLKLCVSKIANHIEAIEKLIPAQMFESAHCNKLFDDIRVLNDKLQTNLKTYDPETCLKRCQDTVKKIGDNLAALDRKFEEINQVEAILRQAHVASDRGKVWDELAEERETVSLAKETNILIRNECEELKGKAQYETLKLCVSKIANHIEAIEKLIPAQMFESAHCNKLFDDIRVLNDKLQTNLKTYDPETCLKRCQDTVKKIGDNLAALDRKFEEINQVEAILRQAHVASDRGKVWDELAEERETVSLAKETNILIRNECEELKGKAQVELATIPNVKQQFTEGCQSVIADGAPVFPPTPAHGSYSELKSYLTDLRKQKGQMEVQMVEIYNQLLAEPVITGNPNR